MTELPPGTGIGACPYRCGFITTAIAPGTEEKPPPLWQRELPCASRSWRPTFETFNAGGIMTILQFHQRDVDSDNTDRPTDIPDVKVFHWPQADISIPWVEGKTARESIIVWALIEVFENAAKEYYDDLPPSMHP